MTSVSAPLRDAIAEHARAGRTAFTGTADVGYAELGDLVDGYAAAAHGWGVGRGELVGIAMARSAAAVGAFFGVMQAGGCPVFVEPRLDAEALVERMGAVGMRRLVVDDQCALARETLTAADVRVTELTPAGRYADDGVDGTDRAMMLFTSGSTGRPKGVPLTHENMLANASGVTTHTGVTPDDRLLHVMPFHHTNGVNNQLLVPLLAGATVVLAPRFRADDAVRELRRHQPTYLTGVPTMYSRMLGHLAPGDTFPSLRFLRCGSAPITSALHRQVEDAFGVPLVVSYGLSEATCTSTMNPPDARRVGSVGTVLDGQQVRLFHPDSGEDVGPGATGEVRIAGPTLMSGYLGADVEQPVVDGWLRTGDLGCFDADGYLTITGRIKDVIIRGGENIAPAVIESELASHPAVRECCVVGRADPDLGEVPVAFVALHDTGVDVAELRGLVRDRLSHVYVPDEVTVLDQLPTNSAGKVDRPALRRLTVRR